MIEEVSKAVPIKTKLGLLLSAGAVGGLTAPYVGLIPDSLAYVWESMGLTRSGVSGQLLGTSVGFTLSALSWPFLLLKARELLVPDADTKRRKDRILKLGSMEFSEKDLFTNILITGAIGSGKTSSVIYPILRQICNTYNDVQEDPNDPNQKWGGLVLDVKGEFYETLIYFLHKSGRNVLYDLILIRPDADYPVVKMQDPDTGYFWFICAAGGSEGREIDLLTANYFLADGSRIPSTLFTGTVEDRQPHEEYLRGLTMEVKRPLCYVGWRDEGGKLVRVDHTLESGEIVYVLDSNGNKVKADPPKRLRYVNVEHVNNGIRYNICSPHLPPAEVASRLVSIAETLGGGSGGDNQYWTDSAKKHIGFIIHLWRNLHKEQASALEIVRLTTQKTALDDQLRNLEQRLADLNEEFLNNQDDPVKMKEKDAKRRFLTDVQKYFTDEWGKLDPKTKGIIVSVISNLFGPFITDYQLQEVFCKPATFSFEDTIQKGKIVTLLAGGQYETLAKQLGTSLKMDFQSICKLRTTMAHYNKKRVVVFMADEAQVYVTAGGGNNTGDENFMALSRQSRVINCIATQSDSSIISVIGDKKAPVYFQSFGGRVWLQNTDYTTNENAARILGKVKKEKVSTSGKEFSLESVFGKDGGSSVSTSFEEDQRFKIETFSNLNIFDAIIYNKGKEGARDKATKYKGRPDPIGDENSADHKERFATLRWFYQAYIENRLHTIGEGSRLNHIKEGASPDSLAGTASGGSSQTPGNVVEEEAKPLTPESTAAAPKLIPDPFPSEQETQGYVKPKSLGRNDLDDLDFDDSPLATPVPNAAVTPGTAEKARVAVNDDIPPLFETRQVRASVQTPSAVSVTAASAGPNESANEDWAPAAHLLGSESAAGGLTTEKIRELETKYGSTSEVGRRMLEFATLIDDADLPMRAEFDPESLLMLNPFDDDTEASDLEGGIITSGNLAEPFPFDQFAGVGPLTPKV
jgi:hypothetical protein